MRSKTVEILVVCVALSALAPSLAKATDPAGSAAALLEGCERTSIPGGTRFSCGGLVASVSELGSPAEENLKSTFAGIKSVVVGEMTSSPAPFKHATGEWAGIQFAVFKGTARAQTFAGQVVVSTVATGSRIVMCGAGTNGGLPERCRQLFRALMTTRLESVAARPLVPRFLGSEVTVPQGCKALDGSATSFRIQCGEEAVLTVLTVPGSEQLEKAADMLLNQLKASLPGAEVLAAAPCRLGQKEVECRTLGVGAGKDASTFFVGAATVGPASTPVHVVVLCGQRNDFNGTHPACRPVMTVRP